MADYSELDKLLDSLELAVGRERPERGYWSGLWAQVREIRALLRTVRYPTVAQKHDTLQRLDDLVARARERSEREKDARAEREATWQKKVRRSDQAVSAVSERLAAARPLNSLEHMINSLLFSPLLLIEAALRSVLGLSELDAVLDDLKRSSQAMKEAWSLFTASKDQLLPADKQATYVRLNEAQDRLNAAWQKWKNAKDEAHEKRRAEWQQRQQQFRDRVEANIEKLLAKVAKAENALDHARAHLDKLDSDYDSAWNDKFRERCEEWRDQERQRISDIEESIDRLHRWIDEERGKLASLFPLS